MWISPDNFEGTCGDYTQVSNGIDYFLQSRCEIATSKMATIVELNVLEPPKIKCNKSYI